MHHAIFNRLFNNVARVGTVLSLLAVRFTYAQRTDLGLIPCDGPECNLDSFMQLLNNLLNFFFSTLLLPIFVVMVMYLGYSYIAAQGKPGQHAKLGSMAKHMVLGLLLMLCAWVIVKTILYALGYNDELFFFGN
jgi:hypothetical protein